MYIKKLFYENVGPIGRLNIDLPFNPNDTPKPIIFVGENGSGKSLLLSNIVDSFYMVANQTYKNAMEENENGGKQYYKVIFPAQITVGKPYLCAYIEYLADNKKFEYLFKSGNITFETFKQNSSLDVSNSLNWGNENNCKKINFTKPDIEKCFSKNVICFFSPDRYEKPVWIGDKYHKLSEFEHIGIREGINGKLDNPILITDVTPKNLQWLLDIIVDSRADIAQDAQGNLSIENVSVQNLMLLSNARKNIETILSDILGQAVYFGLNFRSEKNTRFNIKSKQTNQVIIPTLDSLSTGQMALFNMFSTIIRYADNNDINKSIHISDITGIVVIDEIELHLHAILQRDILPKLIRRFPKIQFIITSHSPLFLLGMDKLCGNNEFEIYQMPTGTKIGVEMFSEFQKAYDYLTETQKHHNEIAKAINAAQGNTLIVTEGATDWKHMKAARNHLIKVEEYNEIFTDLAFDFLEYEPKNSTVEYPIKLEMGKDALCDMCESYAKIPQSRKVIFIADNDDLTTTRKLGTNNGNQYKNWGNNVYSMVLPVPENRQTTPAICIEHLYTDDEIKTEITCEDGISRRLYIGNEFDNNGIAETINRFCQNRNSCGNDKINIIEGSERERVIGLTTAKDTNFALPKMQFVNKILSNEISCNFSNFLPIFQCIKEILQETIKND